jgi:alpha-L-glutamate ligase-like protein
MFARPSQLRAQGVVGINARNSRYIADGNPRRLMPLVNDKLQTKRLAEAAGVPVPALHGVVRMQGQVRRLHQLLDGREEFVIKPAFGAQGDGIMVVTGRNKKGWRLGNGRVVSERQLRYHLSNVLSGMYSLNGIPDVAMLEERIRFADVFEGVADAGVPDLRVIVYQGVPCMAMARLPTRESDGKANLHKGGIGLGIDLGTGSTTFGVHHDRVVTEHPETGLKLSGIALPDWMEILRMASRCYDQTGLSYLGVDVVIDRTRGPLLLEMNARPGLAVQLANWNGMQQRLDRIDAEVADLPDDASRVGFAVEHFRCPAARPPAKPPRSIAAADTPTGPGAETEVPPKRPAATPIPDEVA